MAGNRGRRILAARNSRLAGGRGRNSFLRGLVRQPRSKTLPNAELAPDEVQRIIGQPMGL